MELRPTIALASFHTLLLVEAEKECGEQLSHSVYVISLIQNITQPRFLFLHYWEIVALTVRWTPYLLDSPHLPPALMVGFCALWPQLGVGDIGEQD